MPPTDSSRSMPYATKGEEQTKRELPDDASRRVCSPISAISAISGHLEMEQTADPIVGSMVRQVAEMATFAKPDSRYRAFEKKAGHLEIDQEMGAISTPNAKPDTAELLVHVEAIFFFGRSSRLYRLWLSFRHLSVDSLFQATGDRPFLCPVGGWSPIAIGDSRNSDGSERLRAPMA